MRGRHAARRWARALAATLVALWSGALAQPPVTFTEVADSLGLDFVHTHGGSGRLYYVETVGSGGGFIDYDDDGDLDIYLVNGSPLPGATGAGVPVNALYRNEGSRFVEVGGAAGAADTTYGMGMTVGDFDNDGDSDLYVTNFGANILFGSDGGRFRDVTAEAALGDSLWGTGAAWLDVDNDGLLDLYVVNYIDWTLADHEECLDRGHRVYCDPGRYDPVPDRLYRNEGGGRFTEISGTAFAAPVQPGKGLGIACADIDLDGDVDVYVANDETPNLLFLNEGGHFVETALVAGVSHNGGGELEAGMGVDFGDVDGDGYADLFVTNFSYETNTLYHNLANGFFLDVTATAGLGSASLLPLGFGVRFLDYDDDGDLDLYTANGHVLHNIAAMERSLTHGMTNQLLRNDGGRFTDVSIGAGEGLRTIAVSRGLASADFDDDGDIDLLVTNNNGPVSLLRNDGGNQAHWLALRLKGRRSNRDGIGARVELWAGGRRLVRERVSGGSYLASHDARIHFGLGNVPRVDSVLVHWPGGGLSRRLQPPIDRVLLVQEGAPDDR